MTIFEIYGHNDNTIPVMLAPMAGVTDLAYRELCHEFGCDFSFSEMVSAKGLSYNNKKTFALLKSSEASSPFGVQIFGSDPDVMAQTAKEICSLTNDNHGLRVIDINMGCPAPKITGNGEGSALMKNMNLASQIIKSVSNASSLPVTVKFRKGYDEKHINAVEFAVMAEESGAKAVAVHGRTREQMYSGRADWNIIKKVKQAVSIPVVGNGDIFCGSDAVRMINDTGCDAILIARGAQGNPFIFREVKEAILSQSHTDVSIIDRLNTALIHITRHIDYKGESAFCEMRKHIAWYTKGMPESSTLRVRINACPNADEMRKTIQEYMETLK